MSDDDRFEYPLGTCPDGTLNDPYSVRSIYRSNKALDLEECKVFAQLNGLQFKTGSNNAKGCTMKANSDSSMVVQFSTTGGEAKTNGIGYVGKKACGECNEGEVKTSDGMCVEKELHDKMELILRCTDPNHDSHFSKLTVTKEKCEQYAKDNNLTYARPSKMSDRNGNCPSWAGRNECQKNPRYMWPNCKKSCFAKGSPKGCVRRGKEVWFNEDSSRNRGCGYAGVECVDNILGSNFKVMKNATEANCKEMCRAEGYRYSSFGSKNGVGCRCGHGTEGSHAYPGAKGIFEYDMKPEVSDGACEGTMVAGDYMGCFRDSGNRDLPSYKQAKTLEECRNEAIKHNKAYFGLQYHNGVSRGNKSTTRAQCFLGDTFGKHGEATNCYPVNNGQHVGSGWSNAVYQTQKVSNAGCCRHCPSYKPVYDFQTHGCKPCPMDKPVYDQGTNACTTCPAATPFVNAKKLCVKSCDGVTKTHPNGQKECLAVAPVSLAQIDSSARGVVLLARQSGLLPSSPCNNAYVKADGAVECGFRRLGGESHKTHILGRDYTTQKASSVAECQLKCREIGRRFSSFATNSVNCRCSKASADTMVFPSECKGKRSGPCTHKYGSSSYSGKGVWEDMAHEKSKRCDSDHEDPATGVCYENKVCKSTERPYYDQAADKCVKTLCPADKPLYSKTDKKCSACPADKPFYDEKFNECLACPEKFPKYNPTTKACESCPDSQPRYEANKGTCKACPSETPLYDKIANACLKCPADRPLYDAKANECKACPAGKPLVRGGVCTACPANKPRFTTKLPTRKTAPQGCYKIQSQDECCASKDGRRGYKNQPCLWKASYFRRNGKKTNRCEPKNWVEKYAEDKTHDGCNGVCQACPVETPFVQMTYESKYPANKHPTGDTNSSIGCVNGLSLSSARERCTSRSDCNGFWFYTNGRACFKNSWTDRGTGTYTKSKTVRNGRFYEKSESPAQCKPCPTTKPLNDKGTCKACPGGQRLIEGKCKKTNACPAWAPDYTGFACVQCPPERPKATKYGCAPHSCKANEKYDRSTKKCVACPQGSVYARNRNQCLSVPVTKANCMAKAVRKHGNIVRKVRYNLVSGRWSFVPPGCSVQSGGDWAVHWNDRTEATNDGSYTPVFLEQKAAVFLQQIVCEDGKGLQNGECVSCPKIYNGVCVSACPQNSPFLDGKQCVAECATGVSNSTNACVDCKQYITEGKKCISSCSQFVINKGGKKYCVDQCDNNNVQNFTRHLNKVCRNGCPSNANYVEGGSKCLAQCPQKRRGNNCVDQCDANEFVLDNVCLSSCPSNKPYSNGQACVAKCPKLTTTDNRCIDGCPSNQKFLFSNGRNGKGSCVKRCHHRWYTTKKDKYRPYKTRNQSFCLNYLPRGWKYNPDGRVIAPSCKALGFKYKKRNSNQCLNKCRYGSRYGTCRERKCKKVRKCRRRWWWWRCWKECRYYYVP